MSKHKSANQNWLQKNNVQPWQLAVLGVALVVVLSVAFTTLRGVAQPAQVQYESSNEWFQHLDPNSETYKVLTDK